MRKWLILLMTFFIISASGAVTAGIYASDDDLYKNLNQVAAESNNDYFANYRDNYQLDTEKTSFYKDPGSVIFNMFANFVFFLQTIFAIMTITLFSFSLTTNISAMLGSYIEPFITAMKISLWDDLAIYAIGIGAFLLLIKIAQNRTAQAMSNLVSMIIIISFAFAFYVYPIDMLNGIDNVTTGIANAVMEGPYQSTVGGKAEDAKSKANEISWNLFVHMPWQVLEFGSISTAEKYQDEILKLDPDSDERQDLVNKLAESDNLFSKSIWFQIKRFVEAIVLLLFNMLLMIILIAFSALIIAYQFLLLFYLVLGIFVFLVALIPSFGMYLVQRWGMRILGIASTRILVVFCLSIVLVFMNVIYKFADDYGLITTMFLIIIMVVALWLERHKLLELFAGYKSDGSQINDAVHKPLSTDFNAINALRQLRNNDATDTTQGGSAGDSGSSAQNSSSGSSGVKSAGNVTSFSTGDPDSIQRAGESMRTSAEKISDTSRDISRYYAKAEEILQRQYDISKQSTEAGIRDSNQDIEYGDFVKRTDELRANGAGTFDNRDLTNVAHILRRTDESGGDINDVVTDGKSIYWNKQQTTSRPQSLQSVVQTSSASNDSDEVIQNTNSKLKGIEFFRDNFGEELGEQVYDNMSQRFGKQMVDSFEPVGGSKSTDSAEENKVRYAEVIKQLKVRSKQVDEKKKNESQAVNMRENEVSDEPKE